MAWLHMCLFICILQLAQGRASEYQLESLHRCETLRDLAISKKQDHIPRCKENGRFRPLQCGPGGTDCWCVDADGQEISGSRTNGSVTHCLPPCLLQSQGALQGQQPGLAPHCLPAGGFEPVQCDATRGQCWCVDIDGMELYGTRQTSRPAQCPGSCEVRARHLLHSSRGHSPPQCADDGSFMDVHCKFINTTDQLPMDLLHTFSRFPEAFRTFSSFRGAFPQVSSYCYCSDSKGRELDNTGAELLLTEMYDTMVSGQPPARSFAQTNIYQVLRRRLLAFRLALTGHFRCPSPCEVERAAVEETSDPLVPSCEPDGSFTAAQCQQGGQCWCVDTATGDELPGTWRLAGTPVCSAGVTDCVPRHLQALSMLLSGALDSPLPPFSASPPPCPALLAPLLEGEEEKGLGPLAEVLGGVFPTVGVALRGLASSTRLQETLFGGRFLQRVAQGNLTGAVGPGRGSPSPLGLPRHMALLRLVGRALGDPHFVAALRHKLLSAAAAGAESSSLYQVLLPVLRSCSSMRGPTSSPTSFLPRCLPGLRCSGPVRGAVSCPESEAERPDPTLNPQPAEARDSLLGPCAEALARVQAFQQEAESSISASSRLPLAYGFLLGRGLGITLEELQASRSLEQDGISEGLLSRSHAALRLAAYSTLQMYLRSEAGEALNLTYQPYTPQCDAQGHWMSTQCHYSTGQCWCVNEDGEYIPASLVSRSLYMPKCPSLCQRAQAHLLLSGWRKASGPASGPQCEGKNGQFSVLQTGGAAGWCVSPLTGEPQQAASHSPDGHLTCPSWCELQGLQCHDDGSFAPLQCDITSCWCVSEGGQEVAGSRTARGSEGTLSCDRPRCGEPTITHGALLCHAEASGMQSCQLACDHGYQNALQNALPVADSFLCNVETGQWETVGPLGGACQRPQVLQTAYAVVELRLQLHEDACMPLARRLQEDALSNMAAQGLCSLQLPHSGQSVSLCDDSTVTLACARRGARLKVKWMTTLSELPTSDLPDLRNIGVFLNDSRLLFGMQRILGNYSPTVVSITPPRFGCSKGFHVDMEGRGCVVCPAGSFFSEGACLPCPLGTYQEQEGRDFCSRCSRGTSAVGASSVNQCVTECQKRGWRCSLDGHFLSAQSGLDGRAGTWRCVTDQGEELAWTNSTTPLSDNDCEDLNKFELVSGPALMTGVEDAEVLETHTGDLRSCLEACALQSSCHHVALSTQNTQCQLYTHPRNTHCSSSPQANGFLGNPQAELYDWLNCSVRVRGGASDQLVLRKKGQMFSTLLQKSFEKMGMQKAASGVFRTLVFSSRGTSLPDAHRFCQEQCSRDTCCDGFLLNQNIISGGSILCGLMRTPSVLLCGEDDWDVNGQGSASRVCGMGLTYNQQHRSFVWDFGGQQFTITKFDVPGDTKNKTDYQSSISSFQAIYLHTGSEDTSGVGPRSCDVEAPSPPLDMSVQHMFVSLAQEDVVVDTSRSVPVLSHWLSKQRYSSEQALLWCLKRCSEEQQCSTADLTEAESAGFYSCLLHPDSRVCGAYDKPLRQPCRPLLPRRPNNTYTKKVELSGPVKSFYERVPFSKMVSYSVRNRFTLGDVPLSEGFLQCERYCDEDPCCRGIGFILDTSPGNGVADLVCVLLISLGVQTCGEDDRTLWRTQDCRPSAVLSAPYPLGWYQKPVNQWGQSPALCPPFSLPALLNNVSLEEWSVLHNASVLVDPFLSSYDVIHLSRDIADDQNRSRDWCIHACQGAESCVALSIRRTESAVRCILYPDTRSCGVSSASTSLPPSSSCRLVVREPASLVYLRAERVPAAPSVLVPGHGTLRGVVAPAALGADRKVVVQYLGVPYARPPIGELRFKHPEAANWTGVWESTQPRASCIQPGDEDSPASSEDCLYLNIFIPTGLTGPVPVLLFFINHPANQSSGLLDASTLAAVGNVVVVTASYRSAAFGFLSTGSATLLGNQGLSDQAQAMLWVHQHISLVGGDNRRVTVGAERRGADITSLHLLSPSLSSPPLPSNPPLFQRIILMGGSVFSPATLQSPSTSRRQADTLSQELGCLPSEQDDAKMAACLRAKPAQSINAAQTKLLAVSGPLQAWSPVSGGPSGKRSFHRTSLLLGTSAHDGLISRAHKIKDFEALRGRADSKKAFYQALSSSLGGPGGSGLVKEAASWLYSLQHDPSPTGYSLLSRALDNATRDLFIVCPSLHMASHWANNKANVFLYHLPETMAQHRADLSVPLDVQFLFGTPHHPISSKRFTPADRHLSLAMMTYVSNFIKTGDANRALASSGAVPRAGLPLWEQVLPSPSPPAYKELEASLRQRQGLRQAECSFWRDLAPVLSHTDAAAPVEPVLTSDLPVVQPENEQDAYS